MSPSRGRAPERVMTMQITNQIVCVLCGGVNPNSRWSSLPVHATCQKPSEVSQSYKGYGMLAGLTVEAIRDLCRQLGVRFTYRYTNANGRKSRLFHDKSYLVYQIVRVKGSAETPPEPPTPDTDDDTDDTAGEDTPAPVKAPPHYAATCADWVTKVQRFREAAQRRSMKVVISPRASIRGSKLLAAGVDLSDVAMLEIGNRMSSADWVNLQSEANIRISAPKPVVRTKGRHKQTDLLMALVKARINVWLKGPAGSGKTTAAQIAAKAVGLPFYFTGAIDSAYALTGFVDAQGRVVTTQFRKAYTEGGVFLFDEIDSSLPNALLAFNAMLANGWADFPGSDGPVQANKDFIALAGANTIGAGATAEYSGRFKQDGALTDRFAMLLWDYDNDLEHEIALAGVS